MIGTGIASFLGAPGMLAAGAGMFGEGGFGQGIRDWWNGSSAYTPLGSPEDVTNVNPYTDSFYQNLQGQGQNIWNSLMQNGGGVGANQFWPGMQQAIGNIDPQAAQNYFMNNAAGGYRDVANQNFDQFNTANQQVANRLSNQAVQNIGSQFANRGAGGLRSSGAMQAISEGAINPLLQSNAQIGQMIGGQAGQLQGQGMNNLFNAYNTATQRDLAGQQTLAGLYGANLGAQSGIAGPEWWQPTYANNPNYMGIGDIFSTGADIASMFI